MQFKRRTVSVLNNPSTLAPVLSQNELARLFIDIFGWDLIENLNRLKEMENTNSKP